MNLRLDGELEGAFCKITGDRTFRTDATFADNDGLWFLCPKCFKANGGRPGTHAVICWKPHVSADWRPGPGRWNQTGSGMLDVSLVAGSSSVKLEGGCQWHGHITNGEAIGGY